MEQMEQTGETYYSLCRGKFLELLKEGRWEYVRRVNANGAVMINYQEPAGSGKQAA